MQELSPDIVVDARGSTCPGPLMDLIGKVKKADAGTVIELQTEDTGSRKDVPEWVEKAGHTLLDTVDQDDYYSLYVKVE